MQGFIVKCLSVVFILHISNVCAADEIGDLYNSVSTICSGISDEISKVSKVSKVNTAINVGGTVAAGGALIAGIAKSQEEKEIEELVNQICASGGCTADGINGMSNEKFLTSVLEPMARISELRRRLEKSKKLGNWRTGLLGGTIVTNVASAVMSAMQSNQSELIQHVTACNEIVKLIDTKLQGGEFNPVEDSTTNKLYNIKKLCGNIDVLDIEKIEKRMKGVMGTGIMGAAIGGIGTIASAQANSDKYMDVNKRLDGTNTEKQNLSIRQLRERIKSKEYEVVS